MRSLSDDKWPEYLAGPREDTQALGVIALNYGQLENAFRLIFSAVTRMNEIQVAAIFGRMPNNIRQTVLAEVMAQTTLPDVLKERVNHFTFGFKVCADNRHDVMHSHSGGVFTSQSRNVRGFLLTKYSKSGNKLVCPASLEDLRNVADEIYQYAMFGLSLTSDINLLFQVRMTDGDDERFWKFPLRDKPPPPTALRWNLESDVLKPPSQPKPSDE
jgi:hypothetical protein